MLIFGILIGLLILVALVVIHELGHAIVARRNGVAVDEFGVGFPPRAWGKKVKHSFLGDNVLFSVNWLPLGGFVRLQGEHDSADKKGDYGAATYWQKTKILLAGVAMNWLAAIVIFTFLALVGLPKILPNQFSVPSDTQLNTASLQVASVGSGSPAEIAGLKIGDEILLINGREVQTSRELAEVTKANAGKNVEITYSRNHEEQTITSKLRGSNADGKGYLGLGSTERTEIRATWSAPIVGVGTTIQLTQETFIGLGKLVSNVSSGLASKVVGNDSSKVAGQKALDEAAASVSGPIGILGVIFPQMEQAGIKPLLLLTAIISLSLAVMNVLPIPALDGGRWFTMTIFRLLKRPLTRAREEQIQGIGFMVLMGLILVVTIVDVGKIIG